MRLQKAIPALICLSIAALTLAGCGILPQRDTTPVKLYNISPDINMPAEAESCGLVLRIHNIAASPPWVGSEMLYTQTKHQISSYAYHRWSAAPATLIGNTLVDAAQHSGLYRGVLGPSSPGDPDLLLAVSLERGPIQIFPRGSNEDKGEPQSSREVMVLSATLVSDLSGKLLASKTFSGQQQAAPNPYGGVVATNHITGQLIGQMLDWLKQANADIAACQSK